MILCLSVHHTGTWSALTWLARHRDCKGLMQEAHALDVFDGGLVFHKLESGEYRERFDPAMVYHEHVRRDPTNPPLRMAAAQVVMAAVHATLIPIRDPLASLVTYQKWGERDGRSRYGISVDFSPRVHVDHWRALAGSWPTFRQFAHIKPLCWDLLVSPTLLKTRAVRVLTGIAQDLGLNDPRPSREWAELPTIDNTAGDYPLKRAYAERNVDALRESIADGGFDYLAEHEHELRPFLEELGYRDLMWWSVP